MTVTTSYLFILFVIDTLLNLSLLKRGFVNAFEITSNSSLSAPNGTSIRTTHSTGDYNTTTTFEPEYCTDIQSDRLFQATKDIITLVSSVFSNGELKERNENISLARQQINFNNRAAIDYFGPPSQNKDFQGNILGNAPLLFTMPYTFLSPNFLYSSCN